MNVFALGRTKRRVEEIGAFILLLLQTKHTHKRNTLKKEKMKNWFGAQATRGAVDLR